MNANLRLGLPALAAVLLTACSGSSSSTTYSGPSAPAVSPSPSGSLLRAIWVLSPVGLSLRDNPASTGQVLAHIPQGSQLTATEFRPGTPGWYHVNYNGTLGWVADKDTRSIPPQALVTARAQQAYQNTAGYYFLYPATWGVVEKGADVELTSPPLAGQAPQPQASGAAPIQGVTPTRLIVHVAKNVSSLGQVPTTSGSALDTLDFEVGGITSIKRTFSLSGGGYEGDARVQYAPDHAVLITLRSGSQQDLDIFTEVLEAFGFSLQASPSPGKSP
jgi:hypothetical protein